MVDDLKMFINDVVKPETGYDSIDLLGHSMGTAFFFIVKHLSFYFLGGKVASLLAMDPEGSKLLRTAIIEDVSPISESRNIHFKRYVSRLIKAMIGLINRSTFKLK